MAFFNGMTLNFCNILARKLFINECIFGYEYKLFIQTCVNVYKEMKKTCEY